MQYRDICRICNNRLAEYTCRNCGAIVCSKDYDRATGLCITCKQKR